MIAALMAALLFAEAVAYGALALWWVERSGAGAWLAPFIAAAIYASLRLILVGVSYALARWHRGRPWEPLGAAGWLGALGCEWLAVLRHHLLYLPFHRLLWRVAPVADGPAIVLVHGFVNNRGVWAPVARALAKRGLRNLHARTYGPPWASIDVFAEALAREVARVRAQSAGRPVTLLCHSMGGLVARAYLRRHGPEGVARVVTVGTPHHGSEMARLAVGRCGNELVAGSPWLAELNADERPLVPTESIYSDHDNLVSPQSSALLEGATVTRLVGVGHNALHFSRRCHEAVVAALGRGDAAGPRQSHA